jgi:hypothetical protein
MLRAVLDAWDAALAESGQKDPLSEHDKSRLRDSCSEEFNEFSDKDILKTLFAKTADALVRELDRRSAGEMTIRLPLSQSLALDVHRYAGAPSPPSSLDGAHSVRACCALLALAAIYCDNGQRDDLAVCLARACALLAEHLPPQKATIAEALRAADAQPLPPARVAR